MRNKNKKEYTAWVNMKQRCFNKNNPNYYNYGGRGISIHEEWVSNFNLFLEYIGECPSQDLTLERIDNNKGYYPGNIKWDTRKNQASNRRKRKERKISKNIIKNRYENKKSGVCFIERRNKYCATIYSPYKKFIGYYFTEKEAREAIKNFSINSL